jgi:hypothetical protein
MNKKFLILVVVFLVSSFIFCEELPLGYKNIQLGQSFEEVRSILEKDSSFGFRGDRDVSLLPTEERVLIETSGSSFFDRCWFQFYENKLYTLILNINVERMDYFSMFKTFTLKYGEPTSLNPTKSEWKNNSVILSLEKPLTVKYLDVKVFDELQKSSEAATSAEEYLRKKFLESF